MRLILLTFIQFSLLAGFNQIDSKDSYHYEITSKKDRPQKKLKTSNLNDTLNKLLQKDREIARLLKEKSKQIIVKKSKSRITALTRMKGLVLNSIVGINTKPSTFIVKIIDKHSDFYESEIRCLGHSFEKRVLGKCDLLVHDGAEYRIDASIWDLDGAEGIISDYYYSGEEKAFLTSSMASFLENAINIGSHKINNPIAINIKNQMKNEGDQKIAIAFVNSGKEVIVFFNKSIDPTKGESP